MQISPVRFGTKLDIEIRANQELTETETDDVIIRTTGEAARRYNVKANLVYNKAHPDKAPYILLDDDANLHGSTFGRHVQMTALQVRPDCKNWGDFLSKASSDDIDAVEQKLGPVVDQFRQTPSHPAQALIANVRKFMGRFDLTFEEQIPTGKS